MPWVEVGCADGLRLLVVSLWWLGCWVVVIEEVGVDFGCEIGRASCRERV